MNTQNNKSNIAPLKKGFNQNIPSNLHEEKMLKDIKKVLIDHNKK